jgi:hypothetical protein
MRCDKMSKRFDGRYPAEGGERYPLDEIRNVEGA